MLLGITDAVFNIYQTKNEESWKHASAADNLLNIALYYS